MKKQTATGSFDLAVEPHPDDLYVPGQVAERLDGLSAVDARQEQRYREHGYLAIENAFSTEEVEQARQGLADLVMGEVPGFTEIWFEAWAQDILTTLALEERQDAVRKLMHFCAYENRLRALMEHPDLLAVVRRLLGAEPRCFQEMALLKPPKGREKPWHQDKAYFDLPLDAPVVGVWVALDEATPENGCMHLLPGRHREGGIPHFSRRDWQICDDEMQGKPAVVVPLKPGGCLIFDGMLPHGTPANQSGTRRRALQFHYCPAEARDAPTEERLAHFGGEGRNVSC
jgi:phytanoyl-CoA hydroxylase